jgi:hypothetical protein
MFENLFNKCPHEYKLVGEIPEIVVHDEVTYDVPCYFLECKNCGKRLVLRESDYNYRESFLDMLNLWEKGQYKINFKSYQNKTTSYESESSSKELLYETVLRQVQDEVKRFNLPYHDSENKLIVNNVRELVNNALKEGSTDEEEE